MSESTYLKWWHQWGIEKDYGNPLRVDPLEPISDRLIYKRIHRYDLLHERKSTLIVGDRGMGKTMLCQKIKRDLSNTCDQLGIAVEQEDIVDIAVSSEPYAETLIRALLRSLFAYLLQHSHCDESNMLPSLEIDFSKAIQLAEIVSRYEISYPDIYDLYACINRDSLLDLELSETRGLLRDKHRCHRMARQIQSKNPSGALWLLLHAARLEIESSDAPSTPNTSSDLHSLHRIIYTLGLTYLWYLIDDNREESVDLLSYITSDPSLHNVHVHIGTTYLPAYFKLFISADTFSNLEALGGVTSFWQSKMLNLTETWGDSSIILEMHGKSLLEDMLDERLRVASRDKIPGFAQLCSEDVTAEGLPVADAIIQAALQQANMNPAHFLNAIDEICRIHVQNAGRSSPSQVRLSALEQWLASVGRLVDEHSSGYSRALPFPESQMLARLLSQISELDRESLQNLRKQLISNPFPSKAEITATASKAEITVTDSSQLTARDVIGGDYIIQNITIYQFILDKVDAQIDDLATD